MDNSLKQVEEKIEQAVEQAVEKVEQAEKSILKNKWVRSIGVVVILAALCGAALYWQMASTRIGIDTSLVSAPLIALSPSAPGQLNEIYVSVGEFVPANATVAKVGDELIKTKVAGQIVDVQTDIGKTFSRARP